MRINVKRLIQYLKEVRRVPRTLRRGNHVWVEKDQPKCGHLDNICIHKEDPAWEDVPCRRCEYAIKEI